jgi:anti-sigma regulatory factor (Ser/Thr protein kinase)
MTTMPFELTLSLPHDPRFASTIRDLAIHAAQHVGCTQAAAEAFGRAAEELLRACLADSAPEDEVPVVVRRITGPLELLIDDRLITLDISC